MEHFEHCNRDRGSAGLKAEVEAVVADPERRGYYSEHLMDGQIVMVKKCPTEIKTKENVRDWLQWWAQVLEYWTGGGIVALVNPSAKYYPIVKMTAKVMGVECVLVGPGHTEATNTATTSSS